MQWFSPRTKVFSQAPYRQERSLSLTSYSLFVANSKMYFLTCGLKMLLYMLTLKTDEADSKAESADDMTAAATHPVPMMEMKVGVRCCRAMGRTKAASPRSNGEGEP